MDEIRGIHTFYFFKSRCVGSVAYEQEFSYGKNAGPASGA
jgi:hypothetical protein